jgi:hypothetical protein
MDPQIRVPRWLTCACVAGRERKPQIGGILCDSVRIATEAGKPLVVIGGWSPFILNKGPIAHPGTHDVYLLFERAASVRELDVVVNSMFTTLMLHST